MIIGSVTRHVRRLLYNTKLRNKILFTYFALILLPLGLFQWIASDKISGILLSQVTYSAREGFEQSYAFLSYRLQRVEAVSDTIAVTPRLSELLQDREALQEVSTQLGVYQELKQTLRSFEDDIDVARVILYLPQKFIFSNELENFLPMESTADSACFKRLQTVRTKLMWCSSGELPEQEASRPYLHIVRNLLNANNYTDVLGNIRIDVQKSVLQSILGNADVVKNSVTYVRDADQRIILSSHEMSGAKLDYSVPGAGNQTYSFESGDKFYLYRPIPSSQWAMVTEIPLNEIVQQSRVLRNEMLMLLLLIATVAYFIAYILSHSVTRRISQLSSHLKDVQNGSLVALPRVQGRDEIGELIRTYNYMIDKIEQMNREQYKLGQEAKNAELKALQSQINPHFLYNTLDMINWLANKGMNKEIKSVIKALSRFYKLSLSSGKDIITLGEEIDHVSFYVQIQNIRFDHKITLIMDIPEELLDTPIPKITLQPLVENAIMHGILGRPSREGEIRIKAERTEGDILIRVEDNGIGMDEAKLNMLQNGESPAGDRGSGYGTRNVMLRLQAYFGERYGITFESRPGFGTTATVRLPESQQA